MAKFSFRILPFFICILAGFSSCSKDEAEEPDVPQVDTVAVDKPVTDIDQITDTYYDIAPVEFANQWGPYNVHDPSIIKEGDYFYSYSTDVAFGAEVRAGIQVRRSKDLIFWEFVGWAFSGLPEKGASFIKENGGTPFNSLWAPYIMKVGNEFRLYYSLSSPTPRLSVMGLATSSNPNGPWVEKGLVVTSTDDPGVQTNAIDPTVVVDQSGRHWFYYGSAWDGIYVLELDPATGLAAREGDIGKRVAQRGFTGNSINGNIEGPEIIYNEEFDQYYLFIAYDWLETKYNVRVGRSSNPEGPFLDFNGADLNEAEDNVPMILAPYQFTGHSGWQGVSHPAVFKTEGQYFMAHQGRPGENKYFMVMHVREIFWTSDGWPVVSPERYAGIEQTSVAEEELVGEWEQIVLWYNVVPGYAEEQITPDFRIAQPITLQSDGTINNDESNQWSYEAPVLNLSWGNGFVDELIVKRGRDWENKEEETLVFTGLNGDGTAIWGKKAGVD